MDGRTGRDVEPEQTEDGMDQGDEPLLPEGNPVRLRSVPLLLLATVGTVLVMASSVSARAGVALGGLGTLIIVLTTLDLMGSFDDERVRSVVPWRQAAPSAAGLVAAIVALFAGLGASVAGWWPVGASAAIVTAAFLAALGCGDRLRRRVVGEPCADGDEPRWGMGLLVLGTLLYLPTLGAHALSDPWETHYGEVAREILARGDWISLWWAQDGWFWSKPVWTFWSEALSMASLGADYEAGQMLAAVGRGFDPQPEWAVRLPTFLLALLGVGLLYRGVAAGHGRRAGFFAGVLLLTAPQFALLAHQAMTDMPFVAAMAGAMGLVMEAMATEPDERVPTRAIAFGRLQLRLSLFHLVVGAFLLLVVPQVLYLASRNVSVALSPYVDLRLVSDSFAAGSPGNCDLAGNPPCQEGILPALARFQPGYQALLWVQCAALVLWLSWGERRRQRLLMIGAWTLVAVATMAKGPAGLGLPVLATLGYVVATGRWREMTRMEIAAGSLIFASVALPWFVAMFVRHGSGFSDRLLFHDMFKRAFQHVHDTNEGDDTSFRYYVWQLGYATFPWVGLAPMAAVGWLRPGGRAGETRGGRAVNVIGAGWLLVGFALFSLMGTKFHHYALPLVPPLAVLSGITLDDLWRRPRGDRGAFLGATVFAAALITLAVGRDLAWPAPGQLGAARLFHLVAYNYERSWPEGHDHALPLGILTLGASLCLLAAVMHRWRRHAVVGLLVVTVGAGAWLLGGYLPAITPHFSQRNLIERYERAVVDEPGPLVAYQMNWKGENFYRGNHLATFVSTGHAFQNWVDDNKRAGRKTLYFLTEPKRLDNLHGELGRPRDFETLTTTRQNDKFLLVRVRYP